MLNRVVIVGGGIAGSALSIALARRHIPVTLIERENRWTPASSGIFIYCNGLMALDQLGVLDDICASGWVSPDGGNLYLSEDGSTITHTVYPRGNAHVPAIVGMRRVELHRVLAGAVEQLGVGKVSTDAGRRQVKSEINTKAQAVGQECACSACITAIQRDET